SILMIKEIEGFYNELGDKITADNDNYNTIKLPKLLSLLEQYEAGTASHELFRKRIEEDMMLQAKHYTMQIDSIVKRQSQIIEGFLHSKDRIMEQTGQITAGMLENMASKYPELQPVENARLNVLDKHEGKLLASPAEREQE